MPGCCLIIPAYNEGTALGTVVREVLQLPSGFIDAIVLVDDGSTDGCCDMSLSDWRVRLLRHRDNEGKARALIDGMQLALQQGPDLIVTLDGDGQHQPDDVPRLLEVARDNPRSIVVGARLADRASFPSARYRANRFANFWIGWASGHRIADSQSGFRVYPRDLLTRLLPKLDRRYPAGAGGRRKGFVFESELLIESGQLGYVTTAVRIPAIYGTGRTSHFRPVADITQIVIMVAGHLLRRGLYPQGLWRTRN